MGLHNPAGTDGFAFLEFAAPKPESIKKQLQAMGFSASAQHRTCDLTLFQQNEIQFFVNSTKNSMASHFSDIHGPSISAMGFRVKDAKAAFQHTVCRGARPLESEITPYGAPAIYGVGDSLIYFIDHPKGQANYQHQFVPLNNPTTTPAGLTYIDHVTHNLYRGNMDKWAEFYERLFNFKEIRYFDIEGQITGLKSRAMTSPCGKIRIPLNESSDDKSQIEEFLRDYHGEGIQHIAMGTDDIYHTVQTLRAKQISFLKTPDTYYAMIEQRLPQHGEPLELLKQTGILIDGNTKTEHKLLLQIFTHNMIGPVFYEIIQRKGDEGFGEGNFRALFESIEADQIRRGVL